MKSFLLQFRIIELACCLAVVTAASAQDIELKFVVKDDQVAKALKVFPPGSDAETRNIYFLETDDLKLSARHLILRLREKTGKKDDSTVKLRGDEATKVPTTQFPLGEAGDEESKLEQDKVIGGEEKPSFSITAKRGKQAVEELLSGKRTVDDLFSDKQKQFISYCAPGVSLKSLVLVGPVHVTKWDFDGQASGKLTAELWISKAGQTLEISRKVVSADAPSAEKAIEDFMHDQKIDREIDPKPKTQVVIESLLKPKK